MKDLSLYDGMKKMAFLDNAGQIGLYLVLAFFAILFLQSGIDKIVDRKGNLAWLQGHFANSPLKNIVPILLTVLTIMEVGTGALAVITGILWLFLKEYVAFFPFYVSVSAIITLLSLFFGQRMAKDYAGAAGIVPYLIASFMAMLFFTLMAFSA